MTPVDQCLREEPVNQFVFMHWQRILSRTISAGQIFGIQRIYFAAEKTAFHEKLLIHFSMTRRCIQVLAYLADLGIKSGELVPCKLIQGIRLKIVVRNWTEKRSQLSEFRLTGNIRFCTGIRHGFCDTEDLVSGSMNVPGDNTQLSHDKHIHRRFCFSTHSLELVCKALSQDVNALLASFCKRCGIAGAVRLFTGRMEDVQSCYRHELEENCERPLYPHWPEKPGS